MKPYFTLAELISTYPCNLSSVLNYFAHSPIDDIYIGITPEENKCLKLKIGFVKVPKDLVQGMEVKALNGNRFFNVKILHFTLTEDNKIWQQYLGLDKDLKLLFDETDITNIRRQYTTTTETIVCSNQIFVKTDSSFVQNLIKTHEKFDLNKHKGPLHRAADKLLEHLVRHKPKLLKNGTQEEVEDELKELCPEFNKQGQGEACSDIVKFTRKGLVSRGPKKIVLTK